MLLFLLFMHVQIIDMDLKFYCQRSFSSFSCSLFASHSMLFTLWFVCFLFLLVVDWGWHEQRFCVQHTSDIFLSSNWSSEISRKKEQTAKIKNQKPLKIISTSNGTTNAICFFLSRYFCQSFFIAVRKKKCLTSYLQIGLLHRFLNQSATSITYSFCGSYAFSTFVCECAVPVAQP